MPSLKKYLPIAQSIAELSKDKSTKVGAIILGPAFDVRSIGYNGFPRGVNDDNHIRHERPEKYFWTSHAELNAITNAARVGTPLDGCTLVVTHPPCMDCARAIVQSGILTVAFPPPESEEFLIRWKEQLERTEILFDEVGITVQVLEL